MFTEAAAQGLEAPKGGVISFLTSFVQKYAAPVVAKEEAPAVVKKKAAPRKPGHATYTAAEVAEHDTPEDAWLIVDGKVYDVTSFKHPGGDVVFSYAGKDASEAFRALHKNQPLARAYLKAYLIGDLQGPTRPTELLEDWHDMTAAFTAEGLMDASPIYYTRKLLELVGMAGTSLYLLFAYTSSNLALFASAVLMAMFFFQCGWLQHDFLHNQVFKNSKLNAIVGGSVICVGMGGSIHWWKSKHNQHHATPNKTNADGTVAVDPDIDTVPIIAWSEPLLRQVNTSDRGMIMLQHVVLWPLLCVAYVNWVIQSINHVLFVPNVPAKQRKWEIGAIAFHMVWVHFSIFYNLGFGWKAALYWTLAHGLAGFLTSFVFVQSHNGMEIYGDDKDFVTAQMVSTRNINPGVVTDWVFGGLNYQIEHHLYPTMPRHSYSRIRTRVMEFCKRHALPYESCSIAESTMKVYKQLATVAKMA